MSYATMTTAVASRVTPSTLATSRGRRYVDAPSPHHARLDCDELTALVHSFQTLRARHPEFTDALTRFSSLRARQVKALFANVVALEIHERLRNTLDRLGRRFGVSTGNETEFLLPLTQQDLAGLIGASLQRVNVALKHMKREGLVRICRGRLTLLNARHV